MKIATKLLAASAASVLMTASAFAADLYVPVEQPYVPEVATSLPMNWTGFYAGAHAGYGWGQFDMDSDTPLFAFDDADTDGWLAGVQAGYNVNLDGVVLGIEGDIAWADLNGSGVVGGIDGAPDTTYTSNVDWLGTIRGRVGFAADAFLLYGTAGVAFAGSTMDVAAIDGPGFSDDAVHTGWVVGAGVETMVTDNISLKAEYLYHDFGNETFSFDDDSSMDVGFNVQTAKIGLNFHF